MIKSRTTRILSLTSTMVLAVVLVAFFAVTVATHAAAPTQKGIGGTIPAGQSDISQAIGKLAHYFPKTLACTRGVSGSCNISIKNTTKASQSVTLSGTVLYTLAPKGLQVISYHKAGTYVYSLASNTKATLTVTVS